MINLSLRTNFVATVGSLFVEKKYSSEEQTLRIRFLPSMVNDAKKINNLMLPVCFNLFLIEFWNRMESSALWLSLICWLKKFTASKKLLYIIRQSAAIVSFLSSTSMSLLFKTTKYIVWADNKTLLFLNSL